MHHIAEETHLSVLLKFIDESLTVKRVDPISLASQSHEGCSVLSFGASVIASQYVTFLDGNLLK